MLKCKDNVIDMDNSIDDSIDMEVRLSLENLRTSGRNLE